MTVGIKLAEKLTLVDSCTIKSITLSHKHATVSEEHVCNLKNVQESKISTETIIDSMLLLPLLVGILLQLCLCYVQEAWLDLCFACFPRSRRHDASKCRRDGEGLSERVRHTERVVVPFQCLLTCSHCVSHSLRQDPSYWKQRNQRNLKQSKFHDRDFKVCHK